VKIIGNSINPVIPLQQLSTMNKSYGVVGVGVWVVVGVFVTVLVGV
jgi:hypothetical protein